MDDILILLGITLLSALIFFPSLPDFAERFTIPKDAILSLMSVLSVFTIYSKRKKVILPLLIPVSIYLGLCLLSFKNALSWFLVFRSISFDLMGFSFFWFTVNAVRREQVEKILWILLGVVSVSAAISFSGLDLRTPWSSTFGNPEYGAGLWVMGLAVSVGLFRSAWLVSALLAVMLILAEARSAALGLLVGVAAVFSLREFRKQIVAVSTICLLIVALMAMASVIRYLGPQWFDIDIADRAHIYSASIQYMAEYPWFGVGRGNFQLHSYSFVYNYGGALLAQKLYFSYLHNDYLQLWLEAGPMALGIWLFILWRILWPLPREWLGAGLFIGLAAELIRALFLFPFQLGPDVAYFWIIAGLYWVVKNERHSDRPLSLST